MFGFGGKERSKKSESRSKEERRHIERKEKEAVSGFFESSKERSDERAKRGCPHGS